MGNTPLPLVELSIRCMSEHIESFTQLRLPSELAQCVLGCLLSRAWLTTDTFLQLQDCALLQLEMPSFAPLSERGGEVWLPLLAKHPEAVRLDISWAAGVTDAAFRHLAALGSLTALNISGCASLTDATLAQLSRLPSLRQLQMEAVPKLTHEGLKHLWPLRALQWLSVAGCDGLGAGATATIVGIGASSDQLELRHLCMRKSPRMTDACLGPLQKLTALRHLQLGWCNGLTSEGLASLGALARLTQLELCHTGADDATLRCLAKLARLTDLSLRGCSVSDGGVTHLKALTKLRRMDLHSCPVGDTAAATLAQLPALEHIELGYTEVTGAGLIALARAPCAPHLLSLGLDSCKLGSSALQRALPAFRSLRHLDLADVVTPHLAGDALRHLTRLTCLNLFNAPISDHDALFLSSLPYLEELNLDCRSVSDGAMPVVASISSLTRLDLFGARITDAGLKYLRLLISLRHIELCGGGITDAGVAELSSLLELHTLNIAQNGGVTDGALPHLAPLAVLESLNLSSTKVGVGGLPALQGMASLTSLSLYGCSIPRKAAAPLRAALPHLRSLGLDP